MGTTFGDTRTETLAVRLAQITGEDIDLAVERAIRERLEREQAKPRWSGPVPTAEHPARSFTPDERQALIADIRAIVARVAALPVLDDRSLEEIIGYDENGLPT